MDLNKLEQDIRSLTQPLKQEEFIYDFLLAYEFPKSSITRLKKGDYNKSKYVGELLWKKNVFFKLEQQQDLHLSIDKAKREPSILKQHPRFIIITDFKTLLALDTKTNDSLDIPLSELSENYAFFLPWAGMEKTQIQSLNLADTKAAEKLAQLYDIIIEENHIESATERHGLNIFLSRLLFCFFAEDTGIFEDDQFTNAIASHTQQDGSDLQAYLIALFNVMNVETRSNEPSHIKAFPYVNGGLFAAHYPAPNLNTKARKLIIDSGSLNWKEINPDIFGSMIQAVVRSDTESDNTEHYTSVPNILKVIEPLFLNGLKEQLENAQDSEKKLTKLLDRLYHLRLFDPACGSGNFLIIAYKELCKIEINVFKNLQLINSHKWRIAKSGIRLTQFYGIELDDFAHETAKLSLWLAEHQMNLAFKEVFGSAKPTLPLHDGGHIVCGNATRVNWEDICPKDENIEIYVMGNPPYAGQKNHNDSHRADMEFVFHGQSDFKKMDYISCWFVKASIYIGSQYKFAFVTTNSICQGTQVAMLWPRVFQLSKEIYFAYKPFKWSNNAKNNAGVTCTIIGVRHLSEKKPKYLIDNQIITKANNINAYLVSSSNLIINKRLKSLSGLPKMQGGNQPREGGYLMLSDVEKTQLIKESPDALQFIRPMMGSSEFIKGIHRWCIWIEKNTLNQAVKIPALNQRINGVKKHRENGNSVERSFSHVPYRFVTVKTALASQILIPIVSSEKRKYIPIGLLDESIAVTSKAFVIFDCEHYIFGLLNSLMHIVWVKAVSGRLGTGISYSSQMCYNTFPFPHISEVQKKTLEDNVFNVLDEREKHSEKTMAELYDPDKMPEGLRQAHHEMDIAVEQCYRKKPFSDDAERLEYLFKLYEEMIKAEHS